MGAVVSVGEALSLYQVWHYAQRDQAWAQLGYEIAKQDMRINLIATVREEIHDQMSVVISSLDNVLFVATLLLTIGFSFVATSAMPPKSEEHESHLGEYTGHGVYTIFSAFSLVFPSWCIIFVLRLRYQVDRATRDYTTQLQAQIGAILDHRRLPKFHKTIGDEQEPEEEPPLTPRASQGKSKPGKASGLRRKLIQAITAPVGRPKAHMKKETARRLKENQEVAKWTREDLAESLGDYKFYYPLAQGLLWAGMLSVVIACSVLHSMHLRSKYEDEHWMYMSYMGITAVSAVLAIVYMVWLWTSGTVYSAAREERRRELLKSLKVHETQKIVEESDSSDESEDEDEDGPALCRSQTLRQAAAKRASTPRSSASTPRHLH
eukprot:gnl/TRDRNA2_/TRDRNA2_190129_c0_seq1.p1 gnl/TRDRNA2_/TRDRNA2_190129_c0~~gnl/TRDRNA2_/TRDRNA2_190129_c0_seq1.p1  ORF type:complete len:378 (+),score=44.43 gnl/TRDRNA2_/TRDRNA2_190129_c0_seq1:130-1263(+)